MATCKTSAIKPEWEIKDRIYYLTGTRTPLTLTIPGKHTRKHALLYFDESTGKQKEIRYATNQDSPLKKNKKEKLQWDILCLEMET